MILLTQRSLLSFRVYFHLFVFVIFFWFNFFASVRQRFTDFEQQKLIRRIIMILLGCRCENRLKNVFFIFDKERKPTTIKQNFSRPFKSICWFYTSTIPKWTNLNLQSSALHLNSCVWLLLPFFAAIFLLCFFSASHNCFCKYESDVLLSVLVCAEFVLLLILFALHLFLSLT